MPQGWGINKEMLEAGSLKASKSHTFKFYFLFSMGDCKDPLNCVSDDMMGETDCKDEGNLHQTELASNNPQRLGTAPVARQGGWWWQGLFGLLGLQYDSR